MRVRRAACLFFTVRQERLPDIESLLRGAVKLVDVTRLVGVSVAAGEEYPLTVEELRLLAGLSAHGWTPAAELELGGGPVPHATLGALADKGLVLTDEQRGSHAELRRRDEQLVAEGWHAYAALYHVMARWRDVDVSAHLPAAAPDEQHGPPPPHFWRLPGTRPTRDLPLVRPEGTLFDALRARRTTRSFDPNRPLTTEELSTVLLYTFGCHGAARQAGDLVLLKKTSPSGGGLHPIEAFPLVVDVDGVPPGAYHYRVDRHALDLVRSLSRDEARQCVLDFTAGQDYLASTPLLLVLCARFDRFFWKYRNHPRAYGVLLMDAAHLSQTLYLLCAELGLGAFVTAAVNGANAEELLGLDPLRHGVLAICGCGNPLPGGSAFEQVYAPYRPRETAI